MAPVLLCSRQQEADHPACTAPTRTHTDVLPGDAGGYHPVRLGEKFKQGRYVVLKKLGWGHFSTVWLVLDTHNHTFAALKVSNRRRLCQSSCLLRPCPAQDGGIPS